MAARNFHDRSADARECRVWLLCFCHQHILNRGQDRRHHEYRIGSRIL
jgi:hypothetical protein